LSRILPANRGLVFEKVLNELISNELRFETITYGTVASKARCGRALIISAQVA